MLWRWYTLGGVGAVALYFLVTNRIAGEAIYIAVGASSVAAILVAVRVWKPVRTTPWFVLAAGSAVWVLGDLVTMIDESTGFPSYADAFYLVGYPVFGFGLLLVLQRRWRRGELGHIANSAIIMIAFGLVGWVFFVGPASAGTDVSTLSGLVGVAYPAMDVFLLGLLIHAFFARSMRTPTNRLLTASIGSMVVADTLSNFTDIGGAIDTRSPVDVAWLAMYVLLGAAALHPSMRDASMMNSRIDSDAHLVASFDTKTILILTFATFTAPVVMAIEIAAHRPISQWGWPIVFSATVIVCLVFIRTTELLGLLHAQSQALLVTADTDPLTGLGNRRVLDRWLLSRYDDGAVTLLAFGIDRFKDINDTFGRALGDEVLKVVASRLGRLVGTRGLVVRLGGDEFVIAVHTPAVRSLAVRSPEDHSASLARDIHTRLAEPVSVRSVQLHVEGSIGIATEVVSENTDLVQHSGLAMQVAKTLQPRTATYNRSMDRNARDRLLLVGALTAALKKQQLEVYYQPQVDLRSLRVTAVEALIRWNHPEIGVVGPDRFLPMAERTGLISSLSAYVLDRALAQRRTWQADGLDLSMAVNLSTRNLLDGNIIDQVRDALERYDTPADMLTLEITETSAMTDPELAARSLSGLRALGVVLAIDDYGTGYSSLSYLRTLPVQQLKIDKSFVTELGTTPSDDAIVGSTIDLARTLGLCVIAEGVEDAATMETLQRLECELAQGFYFGRPVPAQEVPALVAEIERRLHSHEGEQSSV